MSPQLRIISVHVYPLKSGAEVPDLKRAVLTPLGIVHDRTFMLCDLEGNYQSQRQIPGIARIQTQLTRSEITFTGANSKESLTLPLEGGTTNRMRAKVHKHFCEGIDQGNRAADWFMENLPESKYELRLLRIDHQRLTPVDPESVGNRSAKIGFADGYPLLITTEESLERFNRALKEHQVKPFEMARFRPNIVLEGDNRKLAPFIEDSFESLSCPERGVELSLPKPCQRCQIPAVDQDTGVITHDVKEYWKILREAHPRDFIPAKGAFFGMNAIIDRGTSGKVLEPGDYFDVISTRTK